MSMTVTIVVPAYNAENSIRACLESLLNQSYPENLTEIIVVDDGSSDSTAEIVDTYKVQLISQQNQGPATARNKGALAGTGEIILFTDSDCAPTKNWVEKMVAPFNDDEVAAVKGAYRTRQQEIVARFAQIEFEERFDILEKSGHTDMVDTYAAGYKRLIFENFNGFDTRFPVANNEDTELSYRLAAKGLKMVFAPDAIVYHLAHPDSVSRYAKLKFSRGYWRVIVYNKFPEKVLKDTYTPKSLKFQIGTLFLLLPTLPTPLILGSFGRALSLFMLTLFICSLVPFTVKSLKKDPPVGIVCPILLTIRAASIGTGAIWGLLHGRLK